MRIDSIELIKFKRFSLNGINVFKLNAENKIQIILGTNGSGKSSLLSQLTPLPANKDDFYQGGSKTIEISHKNSKYVLVNQFGSGREHSFIKDGEELNVPGLIKNQRLLVEKEFNITPSDQQIISGLERFTAMPLLRRRQRMTELCDVDFTYALQVYQKVKERHRDICGAIKLANKRLVEEQSKLASSEEIKTTQQLVDNLVADIDKLHGVRTNQSVNQNQVSGNISALEAKVNADFLRFRELRKMLSWIDVVDSESMKESIGEKKGRIASNQDRITQLVEEHKKLEQEVDAIRSSGQQTLESILEQKTQLEEKMHEILENLHYPQVYNMDNSSQFNPDTCLGAIRSVSSELTDLLTNLPINELTEDGYEYTPLKLQALEEQLNRELENKKLTQSKISRLEHECEHLDGLRSGQTTCPKCDHTFYPGYDENKHKKYLHALVVGRGVLGECEHRIEQIRVKYERQKSYIELYKKLQYVIRSMPSINSFCTVVLNEAQIFESPSNCVGLIERYCSDLSCLANCNIIQKDIDRLKHLLSIAEKNSKVDIDAHIRKNTAIEDELSRLAKENKRLSDSVALEQRQLAAYIKITELEEVFRKYSTEYQYLTRMSLENIINQEIQSLIHQKQLELAKWQYQINSISQLVAVIANIEDNLNELKKQEVAYSLILAALSPTEGLIAEGLYGSMKHVIKSMNSVIKSIWTYKMEIQSCALDEDGIDLDYKFPILIQGPDSEMEIVPDISLGSSGMKEVIDLSYKIVSMIYKKQNNTPLILDEFGITLDAQHRLNVTSAISSIMDQLSFSQLWLVSHYEESYLAFNTAAICVLDSQNIVVPNKEKYNKHVVMN